MMNDRVNGMLLLTINLIELRTFYHLGAPHAEITVKKKLLVICEQGTLGRSWVTDDTNRCTPLYSLQLTVHHNLVECMCYATLRCKFKLGSNMQTILGDN